jgi:hypothetical protein
MAGAERKGTFNIVRQVKVDEETLKEIARLLGIPEAERDQLISGTIYIGISPTTTRGDTTPPSPPGGTGTAPPTGGATPPGGAGTAPTGRGRRRRGT